MAQKHDDQQQSGQVINPIQVQKFLHGVDYPVPKQTLVDHARQQGADQSVVGLLERLPDEEYDSPTAVSHAVSVAQK